jgi:hypothetical protein
LQWLTVKAMSRQIETIPALFPLQQETDIPKNNK